MVDPFAHKAPSRPSAKPAPLAGEFDRRQNERRRRQLASDDCLDVRNAAARGLRGRPPR
jgi:hypothetical protein